MDATLWIAKTGLDAQQNRMSLIANNLSNVNKVDEALIRPGRCFGVLEFRLLNLDEANKIRENKGLPTLNDNRMYTLAEAFNETHSNVVKKKIGIV